MEIRFIKPTDNAALAQVIRTVLVDLGVPKVGTAYADKALDSMYENYQSEKHAYFVVEDQGVILGGAGVAPLQDFKGPVCELQKMYFLSEIRGIGFGQKMIEKCVGQARIFGFEQCYLETMPYMEAAQKLYNKMGFKYLEGPMGNTGHFSCPVHMILDL